MATDGYLSSNDGCFMYDENYNSDRQGGGLGFARQNVTFSAKNSNSIYGKTSTVQNPAIQALIAIRY